ncbi:hypothetical protein T265_14882, partial [Opisthorchis viverrini]
MAGVRSCVPSVVQPTGAEALPTVLAEFTITPKVKNMVCTLANADPDILPDTEPFRCDAEALPKVEKSSSDSRHEIRRKSALDGPPSSSDKVHPVRAPPSAALRLSSKKPEQSSRPLRRSAHTPSRVHEQEEAKLTSPSWQGMLELNPGKGDAVRITRQLH